VINRNNGVGKDVGGSALYEYFPGGNEEKQRTLQSG
jgi:hypothetical protein